MKRPRVQEQIVLEGYQTRIEVIFLCTLRHLSVRAEIEVLAVLWTEARQLIVYHLLARVSINHGSSV